MTYRENKTNKQTRHMHEAGRKRNSNQSLLFLSSQMPKAMLHVPSYCTKSQCKYLRFYMWLSYFKPSFYKYHQGFEFTSSTGPYSLDIQKYLDGPYSLESWVRGERGGGGGGGGGRGTYSLGNTVPGSKIAPDRNAYMTPADPIVPRHSDSSLELAEISCMPAHVY